MTERDIARQLLTRILTEVEWLEWPKLMINFDGTTGARQPDRMVIDGWVDDITPAEQDLLKEIFAEMEVNE